MAETMPDWNDNTIGVTRSAGGTLLLCDSFAGLMRPRHGAWPPPALVMKLGEGDSRHPFAPELRAQVSGALGHYCALQSINSEDAITWSFFGTLMYAPEASRTDFLNWLCAMLRLPWTSNTRCAIDLWRRVPHPQKPSAPGPELDVVLDGDQVVVFVEAKWNSPEGGGQGPLSDAKQMQLRREFFEQWGSAFYGGRGNVVLGAVRGEALTEPTDASAASVVMASITWEALAGFQNHPNGDEFARYARWKGEHSRKAGGRRRPQVT